MLINDKAIIGPMVMIPKSHKEHQVLEITHSPSGEDISKNLL